MTRRTPRETVALGAGLLLLALMLTSCAQAPETAPTDTPPPPETVETTAPVVAETTAPMEPSADPTCETIISASYVQSLTDLGWTPEESEFTIGAESFADGIHCAWADWTQASDHGQFFAWAPISAEQAASAQNELLSEGWRREGGDGAVYITEPAEMAFQTDGDGYGMTYLFGDGWVTFADTKQSLLLIARP